MAISVKYKRKNEKSELQELIHNHPAMFGGNVKLMTGNVIFDIDAELARLRRVTKNCKKITKPKVKLK